MNKEVIDKDVSEMSVDEMAEFINQSLDVGCGLISYRKHAEIVKSLIDRLGMLSEYKKAVVSKIDGEIETVSETIKELKNKIKESLLVDESIPYNATGGKSVALPDIATFSMSKESKRVTFEDLDAAINYLGDDYTKVVKKLNTKLAKKAILEQGIEVPGAKVEVDRTLRINFK